MAETCSRLRWLRNNKSTYQCMHLWVISHKKSPVRGQESFKTFIRSYRRDLCPPISVVFLDAVPPYLRFSTAGHQVGLKCLHIIAAFFQHLSRICSLFCRRERQRNVVGVPINTTSASDPDTGVLYFCTKEQVQREKAWSPDINELSSPSSWSWWLDRRSPWRHSATVILMLTSEEVSPPS